MTTTFTATVTNNPCVPGSIDGVLIWLGVRFDNNYGIAAKAGDFPEFSFVHYDYPDVQNGLYAQMTNGRVYLKRTDSGPSITETTVMYVKDPILGGTAYFGSGDYWQIPCTIRNPTNNYWDATCFNANGEVFGTATTGGYSGKAEFYLDQTASGNKFYKLQVYVLSDQ